MPFLVIALTLVRGPSWLSALAPRLAPLLFFFRPATIETALLQIENALPQMETALPQIETALPQIEILSFELENKYQPNEGLIFEL